MKMDKVAGSGNDEFYTPMYAVDPIAKYLNPNSRIWCPFDTQESNFVLRFEELGHTVTNSHISKGYDFFDCYFTEFDYVVCNPPYSKKFEVLDKLFKCGTPFAMLLGIVGLFESQKRYELFRDNDFEIMYMNRRVSYFKNYDDQKPSLNPPFSSDYICKGMLPKQIVFEEINKKG